MGNLLVSHGHYMWHHLRYNSPKQTKDPLLQFRPVGTWIFHGSLRWDKHGPLRKGFLSSSSPKKIHGVVTPVHVQSVSHTPLPRINLPLAHGSLLPRTIHSPGDVLAPFRNPYVGDAPGSFPSPLCLQLLIALPHTCLALSYGHVTQILPRSGHVLCRNPLQAPSPACKLH